MLSKTLFLLLPLLAQGARLTQSDRPCGLRIAPCQENFECVPRNPSCTDMNICLGTCKPAKYRSCGGFRADPPRCKRSEVCRDDPRRGGNCGMACDLPGICTPKNVQLCDDNGRCPGRLTCYDMQDKATAGWDERYTEAKVCL